MLLNQKLFVLIVPIIRWVKCVKNVQQDFFAFVGIYLVKGMVYMLILFLKSFAYIYEIVNVITSLKLK